MLTAAGRALLAQLDTVWNETVEQIKIIRGNGNLETSPETDTKTAPEK
jgi:hypothetical protein